MGGCILPIIVKKLMLDDLSRTLDAKSSARYAMPSMQKIYLDNNATSPLAPEVKQVLRDYDENHFGNPSSIHWAGQEARQILNESRDGLARLLSCQEQEIIFTSGGSESINLALKGIAGKSDGFKNQIITSPVEHHASLRSLEVLKAQGFEIVFLSVDRQGRIDLEELRSKINERTLLVSLMWANNETGNLYPVEAIGALCREKKVFFHCDAVQAGGKIKIDLKHQAIDLLSLSAHKFHGPKGVGLLYVRSGVKIAPLLQGGAQERSLRGGTQNLGGILGMTKALEICQKELESNSSKISKIKDKLENFILDNISDVELNGEPENRLWNTTNFTVRGVDGESLLFNLDLQGIAASAGAACESGSIDPSHVLLAMGRNAREAKASLRFSLSKYTQEEEIDQVIEILPKIIERIRKRS